MQHDDNSNEFKSLAKDYFAGRLSRRSFLSKSAELGFSTALLSSIVPAAFAQDSGMLDSAKVAPYESPITKERVEFLKKKPYEGVELNVLAINATVGQSLRYHAKRWSKQMGAKVNVAQVPISSLHTKIFADLAMGRGQYDIYQTGAWYYGDFFSPDTPYIIPVEQFLKDKKFPYWDPSKMLPAMKNLYLWQGKLYGVLYDADAQVLYYRKDILNNKDYQKKFKSQLGYDLPVPPQTVDQMQDVAKFFTGWDWNGDGKKGWGMVLHAKVNAQGFFHFLTLAAPYVVSPSNKYFYFDPETMKPLINSEGHVKALEEYYSFLPYGPSEEISFTLGQAWNVFLSGHAVMEPTWGDLPTLAQDESESNVKGKIAAAKIPGTHKSYDPIKDVWETHDEVNYAGNTNGGSWHCVISRNSKKQEAAYDFLAFMANRKNAFFNATHGWTGVQPSMEYEFPPPEGTGSIKEYTEQGWNADDAAEYLHAYYKNLQLPVQEHYLRIPGAAEYWSQLDYAVSSTLAGDVKPKEALNKVASEWEMITERYGRENQKKLFNKSFS